ncbi:prolyl oligopeptidase family serine peptidase [Bacillus massilinigeriensis]|uniref:prolyl oligopeptidase family serine peptidase n=1 Tax=Bacillus massilionigeriensis TaxID=1805475 RepID=UPI00096B5A9F|nr:prolyl oligopeptidase family serine peptidase [Bacillus massilionigeriensis]
MVVVEKKYIEQIPVLHIVKKDQIDKELPFIIFNHGFTSAKEHNLHYAYLLAEKGFRVALPEALFHGERGKEDFREHELNFHFWEIVIRTIKEMKIIKDYFAKLHLIDINRIGAVGTSMGAIVTLGALTQYPWIKAAVSLMGLANYEQYARLQIDEMKKRNFQIPLKETEVIELIDGLRAYDLSLQPEKLGARPLLFWHGKRDPLVPYAYSYDFYQSIKHYYEDFPEKLHFISDEKAGHKVSREGVLKTVEWFETYLK